jgi:hypothetical protein
MTAFYLLSFVLFFTILLCFLYGVHTKKVLFMIGFYATIAGLVVF